MTGQSVPSPAKTDHLLAKTEKRLYTKNIQMNKEVQGMDIPALSMALSQINVQNDFSVAMLSKSLDTGEALGEGMVAMIDAAAMERSVTPHIGGNIDLMV